MLSIKATGLVSDFVDAGDLGYGDVTDRLLERTGVNTVQAGIQIFEGWRRSFTDINQREQV